MFKILLTFACFNKHKTLPTAIHPIIALFCITALILSSIGNVWASPQIASSTRPALHPAQLQQVMPGAQSTPPPQAVFTSDVTTGLAPLVVHFYDRSTNVPIAWHWDFGDGATATEQHPTHTYRTPGGYHVTLTVTNAAGSTTLIRKTYIIANSEPVIDPPVTPEPPSAFENPLPAPESDKAPATPNAIAAPTAQQATDPSKSVLQSPANGATGVNNPTTTLETCVADPNGDNLTVTFYGRDIAPMNVPDFTIVALPDTQNYYTSSATSAPSFLAQVQWILDNRASRNIVFVSHLGDVVDDGSVPGAGQADAQWETADGIMQNIESQSLTGLLDGIPYGIAVGNHDQGPTFGDPSKTQLYNQHFGVTRFAGRQYYGGHLGSDNDNSYQLFSVGDLKFIVIDIEFDDKTDRPETFAWIHNLLQTYPDRWAILSAHAYLLAGGSLSTQGTRTWDGVKDNPNLFLILSGHWTGESRRQQTGYHGNIVNAMLSDYQGRSNGGDGWFRYLEFSGDSSKVVVHTYSATREEYEEDSSSFFDMDFDTPADGPMRRPFQIIAQQANVPSGSCTTATWNNLVANHPYEWYVGVSDSPTDANDVQVFSDRATFSTDANAVNTLSFSSATYSVDENNGTATITVALNRANSQSVTVAYATSNGSAVDGSDYTGVSDVLSFGTSSTSQSFTIPIANDTMDEDDETVTLTLSSPTNATLGGPATATLTIIDDDPAPIVQWSKSNYSSAENGAAATLTAQLSAASSRTVTVKYATSNGTATAGDDYSSTTGTLTFAPGETSQSFAVSINDDALDEEDETVTVTLSNPNNATLGSPTSATLTIVDDDPTPTVQFSTADYAIAEDGGSATISAQLSAPSSHAVTVAYATSNGTATAGADYVAASGALTFAPGESSQSFTLTISDDAADENDETVNLTLSNPNNATLGGIANATLTIEDNDGQPTVQFSKATYQEDEDNGTATITVKLSAPSTLPVSIDYASADGDATANSDYLPASGTLTFAPDATSQSFTVSIQNDTLDEADETVLLTLSRPTNAMLGARDAATLTVVDDDPAPAVQFSKADYYGDENDGPVTITALLDAASGRTVTVAYATHDATATAGSDYTAVAGTLTFAPGVTSQTFTVPVQSDDLDEEDETVALTLGEVTNGAAGALMAATLTIKDKNGQPHAYFDHNAYIVDEGAGTATMTVLLTAVSARPITLDYATSDGTATAGSDYTVTNGTLTFAPGETSQSFAIPILDDQLDEVDETILVALRNGNNVTIDEPKTVTLTINDQGDQPTLAFTDATYSVTENVGTASVTVALNTAAAHAVTVNYATSDGTATAGSDYAATHGTLTFNPGETIRTITVSIQDDPRDEHDETVLVQLRELSNAKPGAQWVATLVIADDDEPPTVNFSSATYMVSSYTPSIPVSVTLSAASELTITVDYTSTVARVTGKNGAVRSGFTPASGTLIFAPGETSKHFDLTILPEWLDDTEVVLALVLQNATNAVGGAGSSATVIIRNETPYKLFLPLVY
ncbi:MAG: Calx-beta domain-containing protein [Caldilineaceae bacterium]